MLVWSDSAPVGPILALPLISEAKEVSMTTTALGHGRLEDRLNNFTALRIGFAFLICSSILHRSIQHPPSSSLHTFVFSKSKRKAFAIQRRPEITSFQCKTGSHLITSRRLPSTSFLHHAARRARDVAGTCGRPSCQLCRCIHKHAGHTFCAHWSCLPYRQQDS